MNEWSLPKTPNNIKVFLGFIRYYRIFVKNYTKIEVTLMTSTKKDTFKWLEVTILTFDKLKETMYFTPILDTPNFKKLFVLKYDG